MMNRHQLGESSVSKPLGNFVPRWEDIENDPEPNLRALLARKRKRKEAPTLKSEVNRTMSGSKHLTVELYTNYDGV